MEHCAPGPACLSTPPRDTPVQGYEVVRRVFLEAELFSVENDLLTPSFKLKRPQLQKRYQAEIDRMYAEINAPKK